MKRLWRILRELRGEHSLEALARLCDTSKTQTRQHLLQLEEQGLVRIDEEDE